MRDGLPASGGHCSPRVQSHFSIHDLAQQTRPIPGADRHEIRPCMARVGARRAVPLQKPDETAMVFVQVKPHYPYSPYSLRPGVGW